MEVQAVNSATVSKTNTRNYHNFVELTGYGALASGGLCILQGIRHKKSHKALGIISVMLASAHLAIIEFMKRKYHKTDSVNKVV